MNEQQKAKFNQYMDKMLQCKRRGLLTSGEVAGGFSGYVNAMVDMGVIEESQKAELYEQFYLKIDNDNKAV